MSGNHNWTFGEEYNACLHYLWCIFEYSGADDIHTVVDMLAEDMPHIDKESIESEMRAIKAIAFREGLEDHLEFAPISNKSLMSIAAFREASSDFSSLKDKYDGGLSGTISRAELIDTLWKDINENKTIIIADDSYMDEFSKICDEVRFDELMDILKNEE